MKANVVKIGNSRGIRIPKMLLEQCRLKGAVELIPQKGGLFIRSSRQPRQGWEEIFKRMHQAGDDSLLDQESGFETSWEKSEWRW